MDGGGESWRSRSPKEAPALTADDFPDLGAEMIPRKATLVAILSRRELDVDEVENAAARRREVAASMRDARRDPHEAARAVADHEAHRRPLRARALAAIVQHQQKLVAGGHVPDVGLALVEVERLDGARVELRVVHLAHRESRELRVDPRVEAAELG